MKRVFLLLILLLVGCGGGDEGKIGGVVIRIEPLQTEVYSDTAFWIDRDGDNTCDYYTVQTDEPINVLIRSESLQDVPRNYQPSPVLIERVRIIYNPLVNVAPNIPESFVSIEKYVYPGQEITISFPVINLMQKYYLIDRGVIRDGIFYPGVLKYQVILSFKIIDPASEDSKIIERSIDLYIGDLLGEGECEGL